MEGGAMWKAEIKNGTLYLEGKKVPLVSKLTMEKKFKQYVNIEFIHVGGS